ncbi:DUF2878 family protein [Balneolaceae bacterium ANBcel3]|nr:DUF2878 family protein [Balneolaceae bacterium ANBcel3]
MEQDKRIYYNNLIKGIINQVVMTAIFIIGIVASYQGALQEAGWLGPLVVGLIIGYELLKNKSLLKPKVMLFLFVGLGGFVLESLLIVSTVYSVSETSRWLMPSPLAPLWICALWLNYAARVPGYLAFLKGRHPLNFIIGVLFAIIIYYSASRMELVNLTYGWGSIAAIGTVWGGFVIGIYIFAERQFRFLFQPS